jgi:hypothetical protein
MGCQKVRTVQLMTASGTDKVEIKSPHQDLTGAASAASSISPTKPTRCTVRSGTRSNLSRRLLTPKLQPQRENSSGMVEAKSDDMLPSAKIGPIELSGATWCWVTTSAAGLEIGLGLLCSCSPSYKGKNVVFPTTSSSVLL